MASAEEELKSLLDAFSNEHVTVRRQWNDWRQAVYRFDKLEQPHWSDMSGGVNARANRSYIHAYVRCDEILSGELAHSCMHGQAPHWIKVCVVQVDNTKRVHKALKRIIELNSALKKPRT